MVLSAQGLALRMDPTTDISVITPVYNGGTFVRATLETVANQSIPPLEVIIIDDGSTDNTREIVQQFIENHPSLNATLLLGEHAGAGAARNIGIQKAAGSWIAFLDSDDLWDPKKLELIASAHRQMPNANFICHNEFHRDLSGQARLVNYRVGYRADESLTRQLYSRNFFSTSAVVCTRDLLTSFGGFNPSFPNAQDYELWLRMSEQINVLFVDEALGTYVERLGNITSGGVLKRLRHNLRVLFLHRHKVTYPIFMRTALKVTTSFLRQFLRIKLNSLLKRREKNV